MKQNGCKTRPEIDVKLGQISACLYLNVRYAPQPAFPNRPIIELTSLGFLERYPTRLQSGEVSFRKFSELSDAFFVILKTMS